MVSVVLLCAVNETIALEDNALTAYKALLRNDNTVLWYISNLKIYRSVIYIVIKLFVTNALWTIISYMFCVLLKI